MPDPATYLAFIAATVAYQLTPGPDMMLVMGRGIGQGRRVALATAFGCVAAGIIQLPLLAFGVASLVRSSPLAYDLLRYAGAAYLFYLGLKLIFARSAGTAPVPVHRKATASSAIVQGMIANLTNPKTLVFMLAFLPQFVDPGRGPVILQLLLLGATTKATGLVTLGTVAIASGSVGQWVSRRPGFLAWQEKLIGAVMIALGLRLLIFGEARGAVRI